VENKSLVPNLAHKVLQKWLRNLVSQSETIVFGTPWAEHVFLNPVGSAGHVVHSSVSGAQNVDAEFLSSGGTSTDSTKSVSGHVMPNLCFCIRWDLRVT
jgi:hypothetical protein